jgi:hypothetical protein
MSEQKHVFEQPREESQPEESPKFEQILFPLFDPAATKALQEKLEEYKGREQTPHNRYGAALITELLTRGSTDQGLAWNLVTEDMQERREFDQAAFDNVFQVVKDYAENAGKNVDGGTGFNREKHLPIGERIRNAETLEEVCDALRDTGGLQGSKKFYTAEELVEFIRNAKIDKTFGVGDNLGRITNTWGLRDKVAELLRHEEDSARLAA